MLNKQDFYDDARGTRMCTKRVSVVCCVGLSDTENKLQGISHLGLRNLRIQSAQHHFWHVFRVKGLSWCIIDSAVTMVLYRSDARSWETDVETLTVDPQFIFIIEFLSRTAFLIHGPGFEKLSVLTLTYFVHSWLWQSNQP